MEIRARWIFDRHRERLKQDEAVTRIGANDPTLTVVSVANGELGPQGAHATADALKQNTHVQGLDISRSSMPAEELAEICNALWGHRTLSELKMHATLRLSPEPDQPNDQPDAADPFIGAVKELLLHNEVLKRLDVSANRIGEGITLLTPGIENNKGLIGLCLAHNGIPGGALAGFGTVMEHNRFLQQLDMSNNPLSEEGAYFLSQGLMHSRTLTRLDLNNCGIGPVGTQYLCHALQRPECAVETLSLGGIKPETDGMKFISGMLKVNRSLTALYLWGVESTDEGVELLCEGLGQSRTVAEVNIDNCGIGPVGAKHVAKLLEKGALRQLSAVRNQFGDDGAAHITKALGASKSLVDLWLKENGLTVSGSQPLLQAWVFNGTTFRTLGFGSESQDRTIEDIKRQYHEGLYSEDEVEQKLARIPEERSGCRTQ